MDGNRKLVVVAVLALVVGSVIGGLAVQVMLPPDEAYASERPHISEGVDRPVDRLRSDREKSREVGQRRESNRDVAPATRPDVAQAPSQPIASVNSPVSELARLIATPIVKEIGDGEISGRVSANETDEPIEGVVIDARMVNDPSDPGTYTPRKPVAAQPFAGDPAEAAIKAAARELQNMQRTYSAVSGPDGLYQIHGLPEGRKFTVFARQIGWTFGYFLPDGNPMSPPGGPVYAGEEVNIRGYPSHMVPIEVLLPDGSAAPPGVTRIHSREWPAAAGDASPEDAFPESSMSGFQGGSPWHGSGDHITLRKPDMVVRAVLQSDEYGSMASQAERVRASSDMAPVVLRLAQRPSIEVEVVLERSLPSGVQVAVIRTDEPADSIVPPINVGQSMRGQRDLKAVFPVESPGRHVAVVFQRANYGSPSEVLAHSVVMSGDGLVKVKLTVGPPPRDTYAVVWVRDPTGRLLTDVRIQGVARAAGRGWSQNPYGSSNAIRRADGAYEVQHAKPSEYYSSVSRDENAKESNMIHVEHNEWGSLSHEYTKVEATELHLQFSAKAMIQVSFDKPDVAKELGVRASAYSNDTISSTFSHGSNCIWVGDIMIVGPLQPGQLRLSFWYQPKNALGLESYSSASVPFEQLIIDARAGENPITVSAPVFGTVLVSAPGGTVGQSTNLIITASGTGNTLPRRVWTLPLGEDLTVAFSELPVGTYEAWLGSQYGRRVNPITFKIPQDRIVSIPSE